MAAVNEELPARLARRTTWMFQGGSGAPWLGNLLESDARLARGEFVFECSVYESSGGFVTKGGVHRITSVAGESGALSQVDAKELRLPSLEIGVLHPLDSELAMALWQTTLASNDWLAPFVELRIEDRLPDKLVALLDRWAMRRWHDTAILRAVAIANLHDQPLTPLVLLAAYMHLSAERSNSLKFVIDTLGEMRGKPTSSQRLDVLDLLGLTNLSTLNPPRANFSAKAADLALLEFFLRRLNAFRESTDHTKLIHTRHVTGAFLTDVAVVEHLTRIGADVPKLRLELLISLLRDLPHLEEEPWRTVLDLKITHDDERIEPPKQARSSRPFAIENIVSRDTWTTDDKLGYELYAKAITESILTEDTKAPLTIGIQAPWGQGKTSLMRMMQERLDKGASLRDQEVVKPSSVHTAITTTYRELINWTKKHGDVPDDGMIPVTRREDGRSHIPTIWFNPLYYRETSQVWAGMAHAIVHQLVARLGLKDRELFWFRLQQSRINTEAIRRDVHHRILLRFLPLGIVITALFILALTVMMVFPPLFGAIASTITLFGGVGGFGVFRKMLEAKPIDTPFEKYVTEPNYKSELGLLHLIDQDLDRALGLLVGSRPIAVFIDDLDRCDPQTVNQVILAINQFLSLPRRNVFFFLGMDMEMVATALEQAQKEQSGVRVGPYRRSFGWRFMEKFVQLPFVIPHLEPSHAQKFAQAYLGGGRSAPTPAQTTAQQPIPPKEEVLKKVQEAATPSDVGKVVADLPVNCPPELISVVQEAASTRAADLMKSNDSEEMQAIAQLAVQDLELNPRTIVRYFCLVRVLRNIQIATGKSENDDTDRKLVLRAAHLLMNWPQLVQWLRNEPQLLTAEGEWTSTVEAVQALAQNAKSIGDWAEGMKPLVRGEVPGYLADASLYRFLVKICTDDPGLKKMYDARMF